jgi:hypothetical protein
MTTLVEPVKFVKPNITPDDIRPPLHITPLPEPDEVTDIEIYRYTTVCEGWICVHVFVWFNAPTQSSSRLVVPKTHSTGSNRIIPDGK